MLKMEDTKRATYPSTLWWWLLMALLLFASDYFLVSRAASLKELDEAYDIQSVQGCSSKTHQLAYEQSYGIFDDISDEDWSNYYQNRARSAQHYVNPSAPNNGAENVRDWLFSNWNPYFSCPRLHSIGGVENGRKWICDIQRLSRHKDCLIYSVGKSGGFEFERGIIDLLRGPQCEIHVFDNDSEGNETTAVQIKNIHFHKWQLKSSQATYDPLREAGQGKESYSFQEIRRRLNHTDRTIDILKIDCEGCEWHTYKDWVSQSIHQILVKTYNLPVTLREKNTSSVGLPAMNASDFFDSLKDYGFALFNKETDSRFIDRHHVEWSFLKLRHDFFR